MKLVKLKLQTRLIQPLTVGSTDAPGPATPQKRGEADSPVLPGSPKKQRVGDDQPTTPRDDTMDPSGKRSPKDSEA